ncbi:MAG: hypothetical protein ABIQ57_08620 [Candidatus Kapaibacterium sp.]
MNRDSLISKSVMACTLLALVTISACSDSATAPQSGTGTVQIEGGMSTGSVPFGKTVAGSELESGISVDSLRISSVKFLISEIKLQSKDAGTEVNVKIGAALLVVDQSGSRLSISGAVPVGIYNKVSIKIHRLKDDERLTFLTNPDFGDFIGDDRSSMIISGIAYDKGRPYPFTYGSKIEETLKFDYADVSVTQSGTSAIVIQLDPVAAFKNKSLAVLDPRDPSNGDEIDKAIKTALKAIHK